MIVSPAGPGGGNTSITPPTLIAAATSISTNPGKLDVALSNPYPVGTVVRLDYYDIPGSGIPAFLQSMTIIVGANPIDVEINAGPAKIGDTLSVNATILGLGTSLLAAPITIHSPYTVTTTADDLTGSLRRAITNANSNPGPDTISFDLPTTDSGYDPTSGTWKIHVLTPLAPLSTINGNDPVSIDGYSQPDPPPRHSRRGVSCRSIKTR